MNKAADQFISLVQMQTAVFATMDKFKQPAEFGWLFAQNGVIGEDVGKVKQKDFKSPPNHM